MLNNMSVEHNRISHHSIKSTQTVWVKTVLSVYIKKWSTALIIIIAVVIPNSICASTAENDTHTTAVLVSK